MVPDTPSGPESPARSDRRVQSQELALRTARCDLKGDRVSCQYSTHLPLPLEDARKPLPASRWPLDRTPAPQTCFNTPGPSSSKPVSGMLFSALLLSRANDTPSPRP